MYSHECINIDSFVLSLDSSYNENYYGRESEDDAKEEDQSFEAPNIKSFYDRNSTDKSDDESEDKSQNSYYHDGGFSGKFDRVKYLLYNWNISIISLQN